MACKVYFDVPVRADVFAVAAEHVVYNEIVVPGATSHHPSTRDPPCHFLRPILKMGRILTRTSEQMSLINLGPKTTSGLVRSYPKRSAIDLSPRSTGIIHDIPMELYIHQIPRKWFLHPRFC